MLSGVVMPASALPRLLLLARAHPAVQSLVRALQARGQEVTAVPEAASWADQIGATHDMCAPQHAVVVVMDPVQMSTFEALLEPHLEPGRGPLTLIGPQPPDMARWVQRGLGGWWPLEWLDQPDRLCGGLSLDAARWRREENLRAEAKRLRAQLDERIIVERAKGVLMHARGIGEDVAFKLLRDGSMQSNVRVGDVSKSVVEAAQWAEAVNRAGQLRMLSQRLVKLAAQGLMRIDARRARTDLSQAQHRIQDNLDHLNGLPVVTGSPSFVHDTLVQVRRDWEVLQRCIAQPRSATQLLQCDRMAEALLVSAEALTLDLEAASGRRAIHVINVCGRQRMRAQRLAKSALLRTLQGLPASDPGLAADIEAFEAALVELERLPLSNPQIRDDLSAARAQWRRLLGGLRGNDDDRGRLEVTQGSDSLLQAFDALTAQYERSLQVIMS